MNIHKHRLIISLLLTGLFLIGQSAVLVHAEEHPFHDNQQSCEVFVVASQNDQAFIASSTQLAVVKNQASNIVVSIIQLSVQASVYSARAPPLFG